MSQRAKFLALKRLQNSADYQVLQAVWLEIISEIENARDKAGSRPSEGNWKYFAGQEKGAKRIVLALNLAITELEQEDQGAADENKYEEILNEVIPGRKT